jgi:hypothetical protein
LVPFGGDVSIPIKKQIADDITKLSESGKPVTVLYFGDLDPKGKQIPLSAMSDIREWTPVDFEYVRVGLDLDQVIKYSIPENPMKKGEYQWEALDDQAAKHIITDSLNHYFDLDKMLKIQEIEKTAESVLKTYLVDWDSQSLLDKLDVEYG